MISKTYREKNRSDRSRLILLKLLALYLAISWQLSNSSHQSITKIHPWILQISFTQMFFSISFDKCLSIYLVTQSVWCGLSGQPCYWFGETSTYNAFDLTDEIFENLNSISNIFQEPHDFLIFTDLVTVFFFKKQPA